MLYTRAGFVRLTRKIFPLGNIRSVNMRKCKGLIMEDTNINKLRSINYLTDGITPFSFINLALIKT